MKTPKGHTHQAQSVMNEAMYNISVLASKTLRQASRQGQGTSPGGRQHAYICTTSTRCGCRGDGSRTVISLLSTNDAHYDTRVGESHPPGFIHLLLLRQRLTIPQSPVGASRAFQHKLWRLPRGGG